MLIDGPAVSVRPFLGVNRKDNTLGTELFRSLLYKIRIVNSCGIHRDFIRPGSKYFLHIGYSTDTSADRERNKDLITDALYHVNDRVAFV